MFVYQASLDRIIDGDTIVLHVDLGFKMTRQSTSIRLSRVDTNEIFFVSDDSEEYKKGMEQKKFVEQWFTKAEENYDGEYPIILDTEKDDDTGKYGRYLGEITRKSDDANLANDLISEFGEQIEYWSSVFIMD